MNPLSTPSTTRAWLCGGAAALALAALAPAAAAEVRPPRPLGDTSVARPEGAIGEAEVVLQLVVAKDGTVTEVTVVSGVEPFATAAATAAEKFVFEPAARDGKTVAARIRLVVTFPVEAPQDGTGETIPAPGAPAGTATPTAATPLEVTVTGQRPIGARGFTRAEVREMPGALGDPPRAIEALPGVTPTLSGLPYFFVRGAPPGNVGYFYDTIRLPALFHALGGPSVVYPSLIADVELYPGPYPAEYGGVAGAAVVEEAAKPSREPRGEVNVRATDSSGLVGAPLGASTDLSVSGRYAYANPVLHVFAPQTDVAYWDYQVRLRTEPWRGSRVTLLAFGGYDSLTDENDGRRRTLYGVGFHRAALRLERDIERGKVRFQVLGGWDRSYAHDGDLHVDSRSLELRADLEQSPSARVLWRTGVSAGVSHYLLGVAQLDDADAERRYRQQFPTRTDLTAGAYLSCDLNVGRGLHVTPGVRADVYVVSHGQALGVDPRVMLEYEASKVVVLHSGFGVAHQPPSASVPSPGLTPVLGQGLQTGVAQSFGVALRLPEGVGVDVTAFQTALFGLSDSVGQARVQDIDANVTEDTRGIGWARGVELFVKRSFTRRLGGFVSYTLSTSRRSVGRAQVPSAYDRRHVVGAALTYDWGGGFHSGARVTAYSGIPADVAYLEAARNPPRTAPYYRLDLRGEKRFRLGEHQSLAIVVEVVNVTLNQEVLGASCNAYTCKEQRVGPITIPNVGVEAAF